MKKSTMNLLSAMALLGVGEYGAEYLYDAKVSDCLMNAYFYIMCGNDMPQRQAEFYKNYCELYNGLDEEQKMQVDHDLASIKASWEMQDGDDRTRTRTSIPRHPKGEHNDL